MGGMAGIATDTLDRSEAERRCLFCRSPLRSGAEARSAAGISVAFDTEERRVWDVCPRCRRWNLLEPEERGARIDDIERRVRRHGRQLAATANVSLLDLGGDRVLRVGPAPLAEQAWWRYGRVLRHRHARFGSAITRFTAYTGEGVSFLGRKVGRTRRIPSFAWDDSPGSEAVRWWRFGRTAWAGRSACRHCGSVLRAFDFDDAWHAQIVLGSDGRAGIGLPCTRCDPWTPEKLFRIGGPDAHLLLRRVLAYQNVAGAAERTIARAARDIEDAGSAAAYAERLAASGHSLHRLGPMRVLALEIALSDDAERRAARAELRGLEAAWRREDEIARIVDAEL